MTFRSISIVLLSLLLMSCVSEKKTYYLGFIPASNLELAEVLSDSLCFEISKVSGLTIKPFMAPDYASLVEAIRTNHVQMAWLAPMSFVDAHSITPMLPFLKSIRGGKAFYYSGIFVHTDSKIFTIKDMKDKRLGFTDPGSTAGRIFPEAHLVKNGIGNIQSYFNSVVYVGTHDKMVRAVLDKVVDIGASFSNDTLNIDNAWHQFLKTPAEIAKIRPVAYTSPIPGDAIAIRADLAATNPEIVPQLTKTFLSILGTDYGKRWIYALNRTDDLWEASISDYESVMEAARLIGK